ncbi:MAG: hypothetical protein J5449_11335 [Oscillospiraceae bacterium]|nr:hypothetical protein [Oscillospiraceae bacterium]
MTDFARARKLRYVTVDILPLRSLLLALFLVSGILAGYTVSGRLAFETDTELRQYLSGYLAAASDSSLDAEFVLRTITCFFRSPALAFLLGFASIGIIAIPLLLAAQGFVFSFSLFSFASAMGREGLSTVAALFAVRMLVVLPCTFILAVAAAEKSYALALLSLGKGKRASQVSFGSAYWYRFACCCVCLAVGSALELWLTPLLLSA